MSEQDITYVNGERAYAHQKGHQQGKQNKNLSFAFLRSTSMPHGEYPLKDLREVNYYLDRCIAADVLIWLAASPRKLTGEFIWS